MARRRRRIPRKRTNRWLVAVQILMFIGMLLVILFFRDFIATGASQVVGAMGTEDVQVQQVGADQASAGSAGSAGPDALGEPSKRMPANGPPAN